MAKKTRKSYDELKKEMKERVKKNAKARSKKLPRRKGGPVFWAKGTAKEPAAVVEPAVKSETWEAKTKTDPKTGEQTFIAKATMNVKIDPELGGVRMAWTHPDGGEISVAEYQVGDRDELLAKFWDGLDPKIRTLFMEFAFRWVKMPLNVRSSVGLLTMMKAAEYYHYYTDTSKKFGEQKLVRREKLEARLADLFNSVYGLFEGLAREADTKIVASGTDEQT
jgi:hypothetical protein